MLPKNRASALILTVIFSLGIAAGYLALMYPRLGDLSGMLNPFALGMSGLVYALLVFFIARSQAVLGLPEAVGFGWRGALRWLAAGLVVGLLSAAVEGFVLPLFDKYPIFKPTIELAATVVITFLAYYAAFRRNLFAMFSAPRSRADSEDEPRR